MLAWRRSSVATLDRRVRQSGTPGNKRFGRRTTVPSMWFQPSVHCPEWWGCHERQGPRRDRDRSIDCAPTQRSSMRRHAVEGVWQLGVDGVVGVVGLQHRVRRGAADLWSPGRHATGGGGSPRPVCWSSASVQLRLEGGTAPALGHTIAAGWCRRLAARCWCRRHWHCCFRVPGGEAVDGAWNLRLDQLACHKPRADNRWHADRSGQLGAAFSSTFPSGVGGLRARAAGIGRIARRARRGYPRPRQHCQRHRFRRALGAGHHPRNDWG